MLQIQIDEEQISLFCKKHHITRLAFFGSVLRNDFSPQSDIDILVEFDPEHIPGLINLSRMQQEFSQLVNNHPVQLCTPKMISKHFRNKITTQAETHYAA